MARASKNNNALPIDFPLQQGCLDSLCSVYAVINAVHLLSERSLTWQQAEGMFTRLLTAIQLEGNLFSYATQGADRPDIAWLLKVASQSLEGVGGEKLATKLRCSKIKTASGDDVINYLNSAKDALALVHIATDQNRLSELSHESWDGFDHYTLIASSGEKNSFQPHDSAGFKTVVTEAGQITLVKPSASVPVAIKAAVYL